VAGCNGVNFGFASLKSSPPGWVTVAYRETGKQLVSKPLNPSKLTVHMDLPGLLPGLGAEWWSAIVILPILN
jgi:hypothetical protein